MTYFVVVGFLLKVMAQGIPLFEWFLHVLYLPWWTIWLAAFGREKIADFPIPIIQFPRRDRPRDRADLA